MNNSDNIVQEVVLALAEADGVEPLELGYALAEYIDPIVLETIASNETSCELTFEVPRHEVTVTAAREIFIDGIPFRREDRPRTDDEDRAVLSSRPERLQVERFFNNLPCTVYQSRNEPGWPIDFISESCRELTGYEPNAFVVGGVTFGFDLIHPDDRHRVNEIVEASMRNEEPFSLTYRIQTADETEKWVMEIGVGLFDEKEPIPFVGVIVDITDLKGGLDVLEDIRI